MRSNKSRKLAHAERLRALLNDLEQAGELLPSKRQIAKQLGIAAGHLRYHLERPAIDVAGRSMSVATVDGDAAFLRNLNGEPLRSIGEDLGIKQSTVLRAIYRVKLELAQYVKDHAISAPCSALADMRALQAQPAYWADLLHKVQADRD